MKRIKAWGKYYWTLWSAELAVRGIDLGFLWIPAAVIVGSFLLIFIGVAKGHVGATSWLYQGCWAMQVGEYGLFLVMFAVALFIFGHYLDTRGAWATLGLGLLLSFFGAWSMFLPPSTFLCLVGVFVIITGGNLMTPNEHRRHYLSTGVVLLFLGWYFSSTIPVCPESWWEINYETDPMEYYKDFKHTVWVPSIIVYKYDKKTGKRRPESSMDHPTVQGPKNKAEETIKVFIESTNQKNDDSYLEWNGWKMVMVPHIVAAREGDSVRAHSSLTEDESWYVPDLKYDWDL
jgi:hypothetical protein